MKIRNLPVLPALILFLAAAFFVYQSAKYIFERANYSVSHGAVTYLGPNYLDQYTVNNLSRRGFFGSDFRVEKVLGENSGHTSYLFSFKTKGKKVTGMENIPKGTGPFPVVLMVRGYVEAKSYSTGVGTAPMANYLSDRGFLTLAPDFLGYGGSSNPSSDPLEERFETYTALLDLYGLVSAQSGGQCQMTQVSCQMIYLWAHSNGGQIALTFLEITGDSIPTALWAPVSKPFPYSILYFTDDAVDNGLGLRTLVSRFENHYDANLFSLTNYLNLIKAPILLQQGKADQIVPPGWSEELSKSLKDNKVAVDYKVYAGADHNMAGAWGRAAADVLNFFQSY
ncbi:MAG: prolyl oligopeptidase family serine peptidase [Patescibacteria group bacterium]|nr:prolyl oligopeptidase family serine peptidase [Patescibacteria group bacterium]